MDKNVKDILSKSSMDKNVDDILSKSQYGQKSLSKSQYGQKRRGYPQ